MFPHLLLTSCNIAAPGLVPAVTQLIRGCSRGAIVTTADIKLKERNRNAMLAHSTLTSLGVPQVEFFDLDGRPSSELADFEFVYLAEGNPFYLLKRLRETEADCVLENMIDAGRPVIASSSSVLVLGPSLRHVSIFDPGVPDLGWKQRDGLGIIPFTLLPHANRWKSRLADYATRLASARTACGSDIEEVSDGEGLLVVEGQITRVTDEPSGRIPATMPSVLLERTLAPSLVPPSPFRV